MTDNWTENLADLLNAAMGANSSRVMRLERLAGGAVQENYLLDIEFSGGSRPGRFEGVLRADANAKIDASQDIESPHEYKWAIFLCDKLARLCLLWSRKTVHLVKPHFQNSTASYSPKLNKADLNYNTLPHTPEYH